MAGDLKDNERNRVMNALTKDQIQKLSPEQQAYMAVLALQRTKARQRLLDRARACRGRTIVDALGAIVIVPLMLLPAFMSSPKVSLLLISTSIGFLWVLTAIRSNLINRRIHALIELLELELQDTAPSVRSRDEKDS